MYRSKAVVITAGTFLAGRIWVGHQSMPAGRAGEQAVEGLSESLRRWGFELGRLKTGTPARVDRRSIDFSVLEEQPSDAVIGSFHSTESSGRAANNRVAISHEQQLKHTG